MDNNHNDEYLDKLEGLAVEAADVDKELDSEAGGEEKINWKEEMISWVKIFVAALLIAAVLDNFIIINANVPSGSMEQTIMTGDRMIGNRLAYMSSEPQRGDVIIFKYPDDEEQNFVKRIIGLPGKGC